MTRSDPILRHGLPLALRAEAAALIWAAFGGQIAPLLWARARWAGSERARAARRAGVARVRRALRPERVIVALDGEGRLLGLTGLRGAAGGILDLPPTPGWPGWPGASADLVLDALVVAPAARGRGVARALVAAALAEAARRGHPGLRAEVARRNAPARRLYQGEGFTPAPCGRRPVWAARVLRRGLVLRRPVAS